jgi:hypothetical protein
MIVILYENWPCSDRNTQAALVAKWRALKITSVMHYGNPYLRSAWGLPSAIARALVKEVLPSVLRNPARQIKKHLAVGLFNGIGPN